MNLITAVIVEEAIQRTAEDEEQKLHELSLHKEQELQALHSIFMSLDLDGSGDINKAEFLKAVRGSPEIVDKFKLLGFHDGTNWAKLFHDLDDGDGTLSLREFVDGLRSML